MKIQTISGLLLFSVAVATGQQSFALTPSPGGREFRPGSVNRIEDLPVSRLRTQVERLPSAARSRALERLRGFHFTDLDLKSLEADAEGALFYADAFIPESGAQQAESWPAQASPTVALAAVPVSPFPEGLVFHSRPGAPNVLYLNFAGENVTGTAWNTSLSRTVIPAVAFSTDSDYSNFSDAEQTVIKRVWQRVAEDFAAFNIDVTTDRPATFGPRTAMALITRNTDADGAPNPSSAAGGIAYVNVFGTSTFVNYRPAWVYCNNLGGLESYIAESAAHEIGHNLGLSHDGKTDGSAYYGGHGSGETSWGPIMGTGYNRNVSQWSKGDYYLANNTQDDLATLAAKLSFANDDHGDTSAAPTPLVITGETNVVSTTPEDDPTNANPANKGVLARNTDVDVFSFVTGSGPVQFTVQPWIAPSGARGGNLDVLLELYDAAGTLLLTSNPASQTTAQIQTTLPGGVYYLYIWNTGTGSPTDSAPTGYTTYGSLGQYFISGYVAAPEQALAPVQLTATVNNPAWGSVTPSSATFASGATAQVLATPAAYYQFAGWNQDAAGSNNPITVLLSTNVAVEAMFAEVLTTNHPTPLWWLAAQDITNDFENAVTTTGANGIPLWQSYVAGLNPSDSNSQLRLAVTPGSNGAADVLSWNPVAGRMYTLWCSTNLSNGFTPVPGAANLPATVQSFSNAVPPASALMLYRIEVQLP